MKVGMQKITVMCANIFVLYGFIKLTGAQVRRLAWWPNKPVLIKIKKLCLTSRFETDSISSLELLLRHNE